MGVCALALVHKDAWLIAERFCWHSLHIDTDRHSAQLFLDFADTITDARCGPRRALPSPMLPYVSPKSYGLWKGRTWAEWVALISGALPCYRSRSANSCVA
jgi:hypothetical protein